VLPGALPHAAELAMGTDAMIEAVQGAGGCLNARRRWRGLRAFQRISGGCAARVSMRVKTSRGWSRWLGRGEGGYGFFPWLPRITIRRRADAFDAGDVRTDWSMPECAYRGGALAADKQAERLPRLRLRPSA